MGPQLKAISNKSLEQLQDLLNKTRGIEPSSFNMAVQVNATDEVHLCNDTPYCYIDLPFCVSLYVMFMINNHITMFSLF
jgi:hypothetical protein